MASKRLTKCTSKGIDRNKLQVYKWRDFNTQNIHNGSYNSHHDIYNFGIGSIIMVVKINIQRSNRTIIERVNQFQLYELVYSTEKIHKNSCDRVGHVVEEFLWRPSVWLVRKSLLLREIAYDEE
ncbi:hypothetical protein MS3_00001032 [Schistosoma haematobium]|uniref:Uncharacterized protein n=1 Tax=Schistosoma haematobium TaxID=6185 RepID=A0A922LLU5_SCHHA|nr:hypothetical protein MS3_00001032 [Schistosoma haematobium]KAH9589508.1 hypothetical protein MS3_00001032 [Schistosoma haematobium]